MYCLLSVYGRVWLCTLKALQYHFWKAAWTCDCIYCVFFLIFFYYCFLLLFFLFFSFGVMVIYVQSTFKFYCIKTSPYFTHADHNGLMPFCHQQILNGMRQSCKPLFLMYVGCFGNVRLINVTPLSYIWVFYTGQDFSFKQQWQVS